MKVAKSVGALLVLVCETFLTVWAVATQNVVLAAISGVAVGMWLVILLWGLTDV